MKIVLPQPQPEYNSSSFIQVFDAIKRSFLSVVSKDEATHRILLQSPNGKIWEVSISNTGVITTALNDGKTRA